MPTRRTAIFTGGGSGVAGHRRHGGDRMQRGELFELQADLLCRTDEQLRGRWRSLDRRNAGEWRWRWQIKDTAPLRCAPCGGCRQTIAEFGSDGDCPVFYPSENGALEVHVARWRHAAALSRLTPQRCIG